MGPTCSGQGWLAVLSLEGYEGRVCWRDHIGMKRFIVLPFNSFGNQVELVSYMCFFSM